MATNKPRIPVTLEPELFAQVTDYRFRHGFSSQSKAIQHLVRLGLAMSEGDGNVSPADFDAQEWKFLETARKLNPVQKEAILLLLLQILGERTDTRQTR